VLQKSEEVKSACGLELTFFFSSFSSAPQKIPKTCFFGPERTPQKIEATQGEEMLVI